MYLPSSWLAVEQALGVGVQELHREVDALQVAALGAGKVARPWWRRRRGRRRRTPSRSCVGGIVLAHLAAGDEGRRPLPPAVRRGAATMLLVQLHVGMPYISSPPMRSARSNTVTRCPALFSWRRRPARPGRSRPRRPSCRCASPGGSGTIQPSSKPWSTMAHSMFLIVTGRLVDAQHARAFARRGADPAGELGEVVGLVQAIERLAPQAAVDQVVPLGDQVVDGQPAGHALDQRARCGRTGTPQSMQRAPCCAQLPRPACARGTRSSRAMRSRGWPRQRQLRAILHESGRLTHRVPEMSTVRTNVRCRVSYLP